MVSSAAIASRGLEDLVVGPSSVIQIEVQRGKLSTEVTMF